MFPKPLRPGFALLATLFVANVTQGAAPRVPTPGDIPRTHRTMPVGIIAPLIMKAHESADRAMSQNNLKQIVLAIHNFHEANNRLPADILDKDGKPLLSWRVEILPYLEQQALYDQFKLDERWDSPANGKASKALIKVFASPFDRTPKVVGGYGTTNYLGVAGKGTMFERGKKLKLSDILDGTSNTILLIESVQAVPWAKPADFEFDPEKPLPNFLFPGRSVYGVALCDGSVHGINPRLADEKDIKAMMTRGEGEVVDINKVLGRR